MLRFLRGPVLGGFAVLVWILNTVFWVFFFFIIAMFKLVVPNKRWRIACTAVLDDMASTWMSINNTMINWCIGVKWEVMGDVTLKMNDWYVVIANHQSWADIVVLMQVLNRKIPLLKFFLKKQLMYVPLLGFAWWALDYPFMKRYSKKKLEKKPHLRSKDLLSTIKACEKFKHLPISVMNFVEGTRFTVDKYRKQKSHFKFLLNPRAGGVANTLQVLGKQLSGIIDVTIVYPKGRNTLWQLLSGKINTVKVFLRYIPITPKLIGDYQNDPVFREQFQEWLNKIWAEKDQLLIEAQQA
jgi:1-acyl-sn-glycerol-3-phosphate acyltransferase